MFLFFYLNLFSLELIYLVSPKGWQWWHERWYKMHLEIKLRMKECECSFNASSFISCYSWGLFCKKNLNNTSISKNKKTSEFFWHILPVYLLNKILMGRQWISFKGSTLMMISFSNICKRTFFCLLWIYFPFLLSFNIVCLFTWYMFYVYVDITFSLFISLLFSSISKKNYWMWKKSYQEWYKNKDERVVTAIIRRMFEWSHYETPPKLTSTMVDYCLQEIEFIETVKELGSFYGTTN